MRSALVATSVQDSAPAPTEDVVTLTNLKDKARVNHEKNQGKKQNLKTVERAGKIMKIGKKEKMKMRNDLLMKKLKDAEAEKKEVKDKKRREKVVIVKDIKPLMDDLEDIEQEIKQKDESDKILKLKKPKKTKSTMKKNKAKAQFLADLAFLKAATADPAYKADPLATVSLHLRNTVGLE